MGTNSKVVCIVGQTASGKSGLAMKVAQHVPSEIICADSQTVRKGLDIGTAKPTKDDQQLVPHHMIDIIEPYERYSVAEFKSQVEKLVDQIISRNRLPVIVGGTGLYVDAYVYDYQLDERDGLHPDSLDTFESMSIEALQDYVVTMGYELPENSQNRRHLIGAIRRKGVYKEDCVLRSNVHMYGLRWEAEILKARIRERIDVMINQGLVDEVDEIIHEYGVPPESLDAIAYPIFANYLKGMITIQEAKKILAQKDWQYARRQESWFKRNKNIQWFNDPEIALKKIIKDVRGVAVLTNKK